MARAVFLLLYNAPDDVILIPACREKNLLFLLAGGGPKQKQILRCAQDDSHCHLVYSKLKTGL